MLKNIIPAILARSQKNFLANLKRIDGLTDWLQVDIMDGKFVKNTSLKLSKLKEIKLPKNLEIHLMVKKPERYFAECEKLKAVRVIFHLEAVKDPLKTLKRARKYSFLTGVALNLETAVEKVKPYLKYLDLVLLMGVNPGFQGQKFQQATLEKIRSLKKLNKKVKIEVDGGVNLSNIAKITKVGADDLVVGSYLFQEGNTAQNFARLKAANRV